MTFMRIFLTRYFYVLAIGLGLLSLLGFLQVLALAKAAVLVAHSQVSGLMLVVIEYLGLVTCMTGVRSFCVYATQLWELSANESFVLEAAAEMEGRTEWYADLNARNQRAGTLSGNGLETVSSTVGFISQYLQQFMSLLGVTFGIAIAMSSTIFIATFASLTLSSIAAYLYQPVIATIVAKREQVRINIRQSVLKCWPNVTTGNSITSRRWRMEFSQIFRSFRQSSMEFVRSSIFIQTLLAILVVAPYLAYMHFLLTRSSIADVLIAFVSLLPRIQELISSSIKMVAMSVSFGALLAQFKTIVTAIRLPVVAEPIDRISWGKISFWVDDQPAIINAVDTLSELLKTHAGVRVCIQGQNGSGKSTLLLGLKHRLGPSAFYYENSDALLAGDRCSEMSKGQRARSQLMDILRESEVRILLLDEWTAHLDRVVIAELEEALSTSLRGGVSIVEVRHHVAVA
jgi:ABC-type transport system involved in cytochrome bd biosynthesis fused ATPase/permease subunit